MKKKIIRRTFNLESSLFTSELHPLLQRIYAARDVQSLNELSYSLHDLLPYQKLLNSEKAAALLADAISKQQHILIIGDFDADGATSTALAVLALRACGAPHVSYLVPNRFDYGYGLTPEIVQVAAERKPDWIITVDNGIASHDGVAAAHALGIKVIITDHHLPGRELPAAEVIVNPNQFDDEFPSKSMAGVGVIFYVMLALRSYLRNQNWFSANNLAEPNMAQFLDLVALGTVADVVPLDHNNRVLVQQGIKRIRAGQCKEGILALIAVANRSHQQLVASDLGFVVGPRLNAAGRLDDMSLGIECLLTNDPQHARAMAEQLDSLNQERRAIESDMQQQALNYLANLQGDQLTKTICSLPTESSNQINNAHNKKNLPMGMCLFDATWHQGVIGILASRIKDRFHRPVIAFAAVNDDELKGSARSVNGVHIRDVLDAIATQHPGLITKFGGHAMAAGLSLKAENYQPFCVAFDAEVKKYLSEHDLGHEIFTDGELTENELNVEFAALLSDASPWGQMFPAPLFDGKFMILDQRLVGNKHLKLTLLPNANNESKSVAKEDNFYSYVRNTLRGIDAIAFNVDTKLWPNHRCEKIFAAYRLDVNVYNDLQKLQLIIEYFEGC